ncbi:hypothetical protein [Chitinophaga eiseniae]|uniref:hypothetical protein n=1 Tax=Chitinophaga eiseniae TaxID=634771 RepID=UPI001356347F|nr:hypothetical protein [Chitinophaga eiseniae]
MMAALWNTNKTLAATVPYNVFPKTTLAARYSRDAQGPRQPAATTVVARTVQPPGERDGDYFW